MKPFDIGLLRPGDAMLYAPSSFFGYLIAVKSWTWISHISIYTGNLQSYASRDGIGVNRYAIRTEGLACVRRPNGTLDIAKALAWSAATFGQGYDWLGLLCFTLAVKQGSKDRMFCSESATRWYRAAGFEPFNPDIDADHVAPAEFYQAGTMETIWHR